MNGLSDNYDGKCNFLPGDIVICKNEVFSEWGPAEVVIAKSGAFNLGIKFLSDDFHLGHNLYGHLSGRESDKGWWYSDEGVEFYDKSEGLDDKQQTDFDNLLEDF